MGKLIHLCAAACFLLTVLLSSCQTERKTANNDHNLTASARAQQHATTPKTPVVSNKTIADQPAVVRTSDGIQADYLAQSLPTNTITGNVADSATSLTGDTHEVTIIIKDTGSLEPLIVAVTKADTIQLTEPNKDDMVETDQATTAADAAPLSTTELHSVISRYAEMISVDKSEMSNYNLYLFIDGWYGTKYKWGGSDSTGIDCSAFSQKLYGKVFGVDILRTARQQHHHSEHVRYPDDANEGDLVFFRIHHLRVSHVGVYLANGYFVHSCTSKGVVISNLNDRYWHRRFAGCGRVPREEKSITESDYLQ